MRSSTCVLLSGLYLTTLLTGCAHPTQNNYGDGEVGMNAVVNFGTVVSERQVQITGTNTGTGAAVGAVAGGLGGSAIGRGNGSLVGLLAGAVIGGVAGAVAEQAIKDRKGIEYVITEESGVTVSIVQNIGKDDQPIEVGERVMVQTTPTYQRVLPAEALPDAIKRPKGIKVIDEDDDDDDDIKGGR